MNIKLTSYILSSLKENKTRYIAFILGFSVAIGSIFTMTTYSYMFSQIIDKFFLVKQDTMMITSKGSTAYQIIPFGSYIPESSIEPVSEIEGVDITIPIIFKQLENQELSSYFTDVVVGIDLLYLSVYLYGIGIDEGRRPKEGENEVMIGPTVRNGTLNIGDTIDINGESFSVTGILKSDNVLFDNFIYGDYDLIQDIYDLQGYCSLIYIFLDSDVLSSPEMVTNISNKITQINQNIQLITPEVFQEGMGGVFEAFKVMELFMSLVPFTLSLIFVFALMMMNIRERSREFGILKALGATKTQIFKNVFLQTMFLILISIVLGLIVGYCFFTITYVHFNKLNVEFSSAMSFAWNMIKNISLKVYLQATIGAILSGLVVSVIPAYHASKTNIVESFRKEQ